MGLYLLAAEQARGDGKTASDWIEESVGMLTRGELEGFQCDPEIMSKGKYTLATCREDHPAEMIREAIGKRISKIRTEWPYSTHKRFLEDIIYVESFRGKTIGYAEADQIFKQKVKEAKRRLQDERQKKV